jgi:type II secretory pathway pseudopilin PulG
MQRRWGFALVELLVVLVVLTLVAAVLFPTFTAARGRGGRPSVSRIFGSSGRR